MTDRSGSTSASESATPSPPVGMSLPQPISLLLPNGAAGAVMDASRVAAQLRQPSLLNLLMESHSTKPLDENGWTFWYDETPAAPAKADRQQEVLVLHEVGSFTTLRGFWDLWRLCRLPSPTEANSRVAPEFVIGGKGQDTVWNVRIFRKGVEPVACDPLNARGGKYVVRNIPLVHREELWTRMALATIGGRLRDNTSHHILGIALCARPEGDSLQVWCDGGFIALGNDTTLQELEARSHLLPMKDLLKKYVFHDVNVADIAYESHDDTVSQRLQSYQTLPYVLPVHRQVAPAPLSTAVPTGGPPTRIPKTAEELLFKKMRSLRKKIRFAHQHLARPAHMRSLAETEKVKRLPAFLAELKACEEEAARLGIFPASCNESDDEEEPENFQERDDVLLSRADDTLTETQKKHKDIIKEKMRRSMVRHDERMGALHVPPQPDRSRYPAHNHMHPPQAPPYFPPVAGQPPSSYFSAQPPFPPGASPPSSQFGGPGGGPHVMFVGGHPPPSYVPPPPPLLPSSQLYNAASSAGAVYPAGGFY